MAFFELLKGLIVGFMECLLDWAEGSSRRKKASRDVRIADYGRPDGDGTNRMAAVGSLLRRVVLLLVCASVYWLALDMVPALQLTAMAFFVVLLATLAGGTGIGIAQLGDTREAVHTLSGKTLSYPVSPSEDEQGKRDKSRLYAAKSIFFIVAMYVEVYWLKLASQGELNDSSWRLARAMETALGIYYSLVVSSGTKSASLHLNHIRGSMLGFPAVYAGFMYWVLRVRKQS